MTAVLPVAGAQPARPRRLAGWLVAGLVFAVVMIGFGTFDVASLLSHESFDRHHVWTGTVSRLDISVGDGSITVVGEARTGAVVQATGDRGLHQPSDLESLADGLLSIRSSCPGAIGTNWCDLSYRIAVPAGTVVTARAADGTVHVSGTSAGALTVSSDDGDVDITGGSGTVTASSDDGDVNVISSHSRRLTASSGDGDVTLGLLSVPTEVDAASGDGDVTVSVPAGPTQYQVSVHSGDGDATTSVKTTPSSPNRIRASSGDGDVTVAYVSSP